MMAPSITVDLNPTSLETDDDDGYFELAVMGRWRGDFQGRMTPQPPLQIFFLILTFFLNENI